jgi:hypothetical protein
VAITLFERNILDLNFSFVKKEEEGGVLLTKMLANINGILATPAIMFALETATKFNADAVYFRYFQDGRNAIPQLYFFDYTNKQLTSEDKHQIQVRMWNGNQVPAYIIIEKSAITIFDSREKPQANKDNYAREIIKLTGDAIKSFRASDFDDGLFWDEQDEKKHFKFEQSATRDLIRGLKEVYKSFQLKSKLDKHVALKLLVQSLLIKYLEERDEDSASGYFAGTYFKKNFQCINFCDTIRNGRLLDLLDQLAKDFNGKIFEWNKQTEKVERQAIQASEIKILADYLDGDKQDGQYVIWRLYSFSYLPIEVISSVYEELLTDSKDIVYTPEMVVGTLVDECMPLKKPQQDFKLIDVSCGSGIFLVKAYKRIVQWWRYEQWQKTGILSKPSLTVLKELLLQSIHGLDIQQDAIRLSIFSLALAILDEVNLDPPTWGKLRFPDLSENIVTADFFQYITTCELGEFDLVIGNPPFNLQAVNGKEPSRKTYFASLKEKYGYQSNKAIPDENPALHFLVQSMKLLKSGGNLCMIQPSGPLFYQNNAVFKKDIFSEHNLLQVIDFTKLADKLWGKANVATVAVFLQNTEPDNADVLHLVANRTFSNTNRLFLEFDHYDFHYVSKNEVLNNPYAWKGNLLGGGRIVQLIDRLSNLPTLGDFLKFKRKKSGWVFGEGFIKGKPDSELVASDFNKKKGGYKEFAYLYNSDCIETKTFTEEGIGSTYVLKGRFYQWGRTEELFQPPLLLIKKGIGKKTIPTFFSEKAITYRDRIIGIHTPQSDKKELLLIDEYFKNYAELIRFYIIATSAEILVNRATAIFSEDIWNIPYIPEPSQTLLSEADKIIFKDTLSYFLNVFEERVFKMVAENEIKTFSKIFCKTLNSVYDSEGKSFQLFKILDADKYYALHFVYTNDKIKPITEQNEDLEEYIKQIIPDSKTNKQTVHIQRIMKVYGQDSIILLKSKQLRYWLPSIALRDADESFADYIKASYHNA